MYVTASARATRPIWEVAAGAAAGGVDAVIVRETPRTDQELLRLVRRVREAVAPHGARVLVSDRLDVALVAGADGVHLKATGPAPDEVRRLLADRAPERARTFLVGRSTHGAEELVAECRAAAVDYCTLGPLHATPGKRALTGEGFAAELGRARREWGGPLPVAWLALGGVRADDVAWLGGQAMPEERWGIAAIRWFQAAPQVLPDVDPATQAARALLARWPAAAAPR